VSQPYPSQPRLLLTVLLLFAAWAAIWSLTLAVTVHFLGHNFAVFVAGTTLALVFFQVIRRGFRQTHSWWTSR
jgi:uncharacterized membrane protein